MNNTILFLGDSFTWGEGLELYADTDKWIAERNNTNGWLDLVHKQDDVGIQFRETNRFPGLVGKELNCETIVDKKNGGSLGSFIREAEASLLKPFNTIDTIIIQFSCLDREMYHLTTHCCCEICLATEYSNAFTGMYKCLDKISKKEDLNKTDNFILNMFEQRTGCSLSNELFFKKFDKLQGEWNRQIVEIFIEKHVNKWKANGLRNIYFIDSWDPVSSRAIFNVLTGNNQYFIPLIGQDEKLYLKWQAWENTFKYRRIHREFPETHNQHPTLIQHKYLARSIIRFLSNPLNNKEFPVVKSLI
jgi:hypothetical protein